MNRDREIPRFPLPPLLNQPLIDELTNLCFYQQDRVALVDLLFVFGSNILHNELGQLISQAIDQTEVKRILITGGVARYTDLRIDSVAESERILAAIRYRDRTDLRFMLETNSTNTLENVVEARKAYDFQTSTQLLFIAHSYATMRSYLTLRKFHTQGEITGWPLILPSEIEGYSVSQADWYKSEKGRALVWGEYLRFETYGRRGDFPIQAVEHTLHKIQMLLS
ncbi:ElyC/SanA/YdcF family protein [Spirosoma pollinicola]|uniref:ElyC/SanA/YdcF family protein n=1 Tax=Spirosoma pollinicola TaxID=2057025 RepID=UPI0012FD6F26|nr:ElyC/SanA/YdcF family protein [Spirosoma pollinicola]